LPEGSNATGCGGEGIENAASDEAFAGHFMPSASCAAMTVCPALLETPHDLINQPDYLRQLFGGAVA
jgi:hypothetical protein